MKLRLLPLAFFALFFISCGSHTIDNNSKEQPSTTLEILGAEQTGINFANNLKESPEFHYFSYTYAYHGGGVAVGDINSDGLPDIYFTSNQNENKLYLNKGNLQFEDITETAGVSGKKGWTTGVTMADVNADGLLDIYVCMSGMFADPSTRENLLYINNGDNTFSERAKEFGINNNGHTTMAYFADLDNDSDLDLYVVNHRVDWSMNTRVIIDPNFVPNEYETDRLYINNGKGKFEDRTEQAGVKNKAWGLSASIGDFNQDGYNDIYVANDFLEPDFLYINQKDGTFKEQNTAYTRHISFYGMGSDWADFNNDALPDLCVLDMTPPDHKRSKQNMASMRPDQFFKMVEVGWHHQYMTNTLQMNNGNGSFSEIAHLAGIDRTDWSWAPLFVDLDNDGLKDLFVTNGIRRDVTNNDFKIQIKKVIAEKGSTLDFEQIMNMIPRSVSDNLVYRNNGDLHFDKANESWNYKHKMLSTGAAYADLDGDGDMDLITNNLDSEASIIKNTSNDNGGSRFLQVELKGEGNNPFAIGTKATLYTNSGPQYLELLHARGFQSSVEPLLHFGLGDSEMDMLVIDWYDGTSSVITELTPNERIVVDKSTTKKLDESKTYKSVMFADISNSSGLNHIHVESDFNDFATEILLPHRQSQHGPSLAVADVNGDDLDDVFVGSSVGNSPVLLLQTTDGKFSEAGSQPWDKNKRAEEIGAHFFDADGDDDLDLYVACGSTEFPLGDKSYQDKLYLNDGTGVFSEAKNALPAMLSSTKTVTSTDVDGDGDLDLFVGGRNVPGAYPKSANSFLLINEDGKFLDQTDEWSDELRLAGMVTDAVFADITADNLPDLILCGEWSAIRFFENTGETFEEITEEVGDENLKGWWYSLNISDLDNDGDLDIVAGNLGLNNKFHPKKKKPLEIYMNDFDKNGTNDIVLAKHSGADCLPVRGKECSSDQMPFINDKFPTFAQFANADLFTIYGNENLENAYHLNVTEFASMVLINEDGKFSFKPLPTIAQTSPINGTLLEDVNNDGHVDILAVGNMYGAEVETNRYDASIGHVLLGDGKMNFTPVPAQLSGFFAPYNARAVAKVRMADDKFGIAVANNMAPLQLFTLSDISK